MIAEYSPSPDQVIRSEPATVVRADPGDETGRKHRRALENPQVVQSLASASCLGGAADMLADIQQHGSAVTRLVAGLAAAVASVLPGALASADERLQAAASVLGAADDDGRAEAILRAEPETAGRA